MWGSTGRDRSPALNIGADEVIRRIEVLLVDVGQVVVAGRDAEEPMPRKPTWR